MEFTGIGVVPYEPPARELRSFRKKKIAHLDEVSWSAVIHRGSLIGNDWVVFLGFQKVNL